MTQNLFLSAQGSSAIETKYAGKVNGEQVRARLALPNSSRLHLRDLAGCREETVGKDLLTCDAKKVLLNIKQSLVVNGESVTCAQTSCGEDADEKDI